MEPNLVTKEEFEVYEEIRKSGQTNMWSYRNINILSDGLITKESHIEIIKNWRELAEKYPEVVS